jgi:hypothetical protein
MIRPIRALACAVMITAPAVASAAVVSPEFGRFDALVIQDPSSRLGIVAETPERLQGAAGLEGWTSFRASMGGTWNVWLDRRSGSPLLARGSGLRWIGPDQEASAQLLETRAREFVGAHASLFGIRAGELVLSAEGTGSTDRDHWVVVFDRSVGGVPVEDERFVLYVTGGNLVAFGANRWGAIASVPAARIDAQAAFTALTAYMGVTGTDVYETVERPHLTFVAAPPAQGDGSVYTGPAGSGVAHNLVWRAAIRVDGEPGTWVGKIDALTGRLVAFFDDDRYGQVTGGIFPSSNDQNCADLGCELPGFPFPYTNVTVQKSSTPTDDMGFFACSGHGSKTSTATMSGTYVKVSDTCGLGSDSGNCNGPLDFGTSTGTDCTAPSGMSGDTHAARSSYYHLNRAKEKARYWLPSNSWVNQQLADKVNTVATCNAFYNGSVNFYKSGGGCRNTGEIAGVVTHEYGHGLDQNDGGGYDNPSEAYADVISMLQERRSCIGRGFFQSGACSGYGDACLSCSGIRDHDWDQHVSHTAATPANFTAPACGGGSGPCGREVHCEAYVPAEAIYDLAARDLPATGLDAASSWQLAEKLFYKSRQGSGGNAFNCSLPSSDGCGATSWFQEVLASDDEDGNLANGTPHAAAIFAAFNRHAIACGTAADPANQSTSTCAALAAPVPSVSSGAGSVTLSWSAVTGAARYLVLRSDIGCGGSSNVIATVAAPTTTYTDTSLPSGFPVYYRVQAQAANAACDGRVSSCTQASAN